MLRQLASLVVASLALALLAALGSAGRAAAAENNIGRRVGDFTLLDYRGAERALADFEGQRLLVVAFVGCECPLVKVYVPRLNELAAHYGRQGVGFLAINSNHQDSLAELAALVKESELAIPLVKDAGNVVADAFAAQRTPEVFVLDAERTIRYRGRIDDQFGVGFQRPQANHRELAAALDELLAGQPVSQPETQAAGCLIGRVPKIEPTGEVTYARQVSRILNERCISCHRSGEVAPFALTDYEEALGWSETILEVIDQGRMPPWSANPEYGQFKNDCRLSDEEKRLLHAWVDNGCPEGDAADLPVPPTFIDGWQIGEPDLVVNMPEPYTVPAEGVVEYQYFTVDPQLSHDVWVKAAEARPGNRALVHHIIVFVSPPGAERAEALGLRSLEGLGGYAPGMPPMVFGPGQAILVKAGSKIRFQMHYTPIGKEQTDQSYVGLVFEDPKRVTHRVDGHMAPNFTFQIPPDAGNYEVTSKYTFRRETQLIELQPHMHLRGKSFRYEAVYPDGSREILLDVPRYDFNWQLTYRLAEPKRMPKGTVMHCTAHFDNSSANPANPNPSETVRWGDQTWEEMMIGWFTTVEPVAADAARASSGQGGL